MPRPLLSLLVLLSACGRARPPEPAAPPDRPQVSLHGVKLWLFRGAEVTVQGRAARVAFHRQSSEVSAEEALIQLRPEPAGPSSRTVEIRAPRLQGLLTTRQADLSGGIQLRSQAGLQGETERAHFDGARMAARGDRPVRLRAPDVALAADGFAFDFREETYDFEGNVVTEVLRGSP